MLISINKYTNGCITSHLIPFSDSLTWFIWPQHIVANSSSSVADSLEANSLPSATAFLVDGDKWGQTFVFHAVVQTQCPFTVTSTFFQAVYLLSRNRSQTGFKLLNVCLVSMELFFFISQLYIWVYQLLSVWREQTCYTVRCQASRSDCQEIVHSSLRDIQTCSTEDSSHTSTKIKRRSLHHQEQT